MTFTTSDNAGNEVIGTAVVTILDTTAPTLDVPGEISILSPQPSGVPITEQIISEFLAAVESNDIVDASPTVSHDAPETFLIGTTAVTFTTIDASGNSTAATANVIVSSAGYDFGDAPEGYPVLRADNGASHTITSLFLGRSVDAETDGQPSELADGDGDDENGVDVTAEPVASEDDSTRASFIVTVSEPGVLDAWIDFNRDFDWDDEGEQIALSMPITRGYAFVTYVVPAGTAAGSVTARFRLSAEGGLAPTGHAYSGEVEDLVFDILEADSDPVPEVDVDESAATIVNEGGRIVIRGETQELFSVPADDVGAIDVDSGLGESVLTVDLSGGSVIPQGGLTLRGAGTHNTIRVVGGDSEIDLSEDGNTYASNFDVIDLSDPGATKLMVETGSVQQLSGDEPVEVIGEENDEISFEDPENWRMGEPSVRDGSFIRPVVHVESGEALNVDLPNGWHNLVSALDTDNSGGPLTPFDALQGVNLLSARFRDGILGDELPDPAALEDFGNTWIDTNNDGFITPFDILGVINGLTAQQNASRASGEQVSDTALIQWSQQSDQLSGSIASTGESDRVDAIEEHMTFESKVASFDDVAQSVRAEVEIAHAETTSDQYAEAVDQLFSDAG